MSRYVAELTYHRRYTLKTLGTRKLPVTINKCPNAYNKKNKKYAKETVALKHAFSGYNLQP